MRLRERHAVARGAFTLMEILVVMAIIVVLAGASIPIYMTYMENSRKDKAKTDVKHTLTQSADLYKLRYGDYPPDLNSLTQMRPDGASPDLKPEHLIDPWQHPYQYAYPGQHNAAYGQPDIWSLGPRMGDPNGIIGNW